MTYKRLLTIMAFVFLAGLVNDSRAESDGTARIVLHCPATAKVVINDEPTSISGRQRIFRSKMPNGVRRSYAITATLTDEAGFGWKHSKAVILSPNETKPVTMSRRDFVADSSSWVVEPSLIQVKKEAVIQITVKAAINGNIPSPYAITFHAGTKRLAAYPAPSVSGTANGNVRQYFIDPRGLPPFPNTRFPSIAVVARLELDGVDKGSVGNVQLVPDGTIAPAATEIEEEVAKTKTELAETKTELAETTTEVAESKTEVAESKTELAETKTEVAESKTELAESRFEALEAELKETKAELKETKEELKETKEELKETKAKTQSDCCR